MFSEWLAYWRIEPWGQIREELRTAHTIRSIQNFFKGKGAQIPDLMRYILMPLDGMQRQQSRDEVAARMKAFAMQMQRMRDAEAARKAKADQVQACHQ